MGQYVQCSIIGTCFSHKKFSDVAMGRYALDTKHQELVRLIQLWYALMHSGNETYDEMIMEKCYHLLERHARLTYKNKHRSKT